MCVPWSPETRIKGNFVLQYVSEFKSCVEVSRGGRHGLLVPKVSVVVKQHWTWTICILSRLLFVISAFERQFSMLFITNTDSVHFFPGCPKASSPRESPSASPDVWGCRVVGMLQQMNCCRPARQSYTGRIWKRTRPRVLVQNQHSKQLIRAWKTSHKHNNKEK